ncbi:DUF167 family protein [Piscinibacter koreensis]|uniref:DUF167 domain-containing protein n=1 Tax=Piscinibacter koreensis TaxID=2742824 RepID=UPI001C37E01C
MKLLQIKVQPNARLSVLVEPGEDGTWAAELKAPPVDGKANDELLRLVAERFGVARSRVTLRTGASARLKRIRVDDD